MRARWLLLVAVAAAGLLGAMAARSADGQAGRTLTFRVAPPAPRDFHVVDVPPRGLSLGDRFVGAVSLRRDGRLLGRALSDCTITDATFKGQQCSVVLVLRGGQITSQTGGLDRPLPGTHLSPVDVFAVTGGTGSFTGAGGTITIRHRPRSDVFVVRLGT